MYINAMILPAGLMFTKKIMINSCLGEKQGVKPSGPFKQFFSIGSWQKLGKTGYNTTLNEKK